MRTASSCRVSGDCPNNTANRHFCKALISLNYCLHLPSVLAYDNNIYKRKVKFMKAVKATTFKQFWKIRTLHALAFSGSERKSLSVYRSRQKDGKSDIWYFEENDKFVGYAIVTPGRKYVLVNYLAVDTSLRGQSKGSVMLKMLQYEYNGTSLIAEVDLEINPDNPHSKRSKRKLFYLKAGMKELGVTATYIDTDLEILGTPDCEMTFEDYYKFYAEAYNIYTASGIRHCKKTEI